MKRLALAAALLLPSAASAQAFVHDAARFEKHPLLLDVRLFAGYDAALTPREGGYGVRVALSAGVLDHTRIGGWASFAFGGGAECVDGGGSSPLLGCFVLDQGALGVELRQGLVAGDLGQLGLDIGFGAHNVPEPIFIVGLHQHAQLVGSLSAGRLLVSLFAGGALDETPFTSTLIREAYGGLGAELALGAFRPSLTLIVNHDWLNTTRPERTFGMLALGLGYQFL